MLAIWRAAAEEFDKGRDFVLATIIDVRGSSPRHVGTRFLIRKDGQIVGTIGGGLFEAKVQMFAANALENRTSHRLMFAFRGDETQSAEMICDMICGGDTQVLLEYVDASDTVARAIFEKLLELTVARKTGLFFTHANIPVDDQGTIDRMLVDDQGLRLGGFEGDDAAVQSVPESRLLKSAQILDAPDAPSAVFLEWIHPSETVFIFGAGHVGECVAHLSAYAGFRAVVLDDREDYANIERIPEADQAIVLESFEQAFKGLPVDRDSYVVILTRGHQHDKTVLGQALETDAAYIGMIGSRRKNRLICEALLQEGHSRDALEKVYAPIGLPIGGETPQEIGISIVSQIIQVRNKKEELLQVRE